MKSIHSLRVLSLLGFLLLMAPFYDHCNGHYGVMRKTEEAPIEVPAVEESIIEVDTISSEVVSEKDTVSYTNVEETPFFQKVFEFIDDENSQSAFEMATFSISAFIECDFKNLKTDLIKDIKKDNCQGIIFQFNNLCFLFIVGFSFLILLFSFTKKWRLIYMYSLINLILLLITIICIVFFDDLFEEIKQIKWGYYAFSIVQILILVLSKSERNSKING
ncbi:MAG: hypothetical protein V4548_01110 [Bacteroidota bacterium]